MRNNCKMNKLHENTIYTNKQFQLGQLNQEVVPVVVVVVVVVVIVTIN